jgi:tetratricopeptide (TPR) repeat protein
MKFLHKTLSSIFFSIAFAGMGQDNARLEFIHAISEKASENCAGEVYGEDELETKKNLSLYQELYKHKSYDEALPYWRAVFFSAPKSSQNLYIRGVKMYKNLAKANEGEWKETYIDSLLAISETRKFCFGPTAKIQKSEAFDWYTYRRKGNEPHVLKLFSNTFETYQNDSFVPPATFLVYWLDLALRANIEADTLSTDSVMVIYQIVSEIIENQLQTEKAGEYEGARQRINEILKAFDFVIDCDQVLPMIEKNYRANEEDTSTILKTYQKLKNFSCTDSTLFMEVASRVAEIQPTYQLFLFLAKKEKDAGNTDKAIAYYYKAIDYLGEDIEKEKIYLRIGNMYYNKGNFTKVRSIANQVLKMNPNSGKAYLVIGRTYASSGKICGTGTDFKSHTIVWAAVDTWKKAIAVDKTVREEAQGLINKYSQYMPTKQELFMNGIKLGRKYKISCFGVTTRVRSSD